MRGRRMKQASLKKFIALQRSLLTEKAELEERLQAINKALAGTTAPTTTGGPRKKRTMSAAAKAKISAAQKARWAKQKSARK